MQGDVGFWRLTNASMQPAIAARCADLRERHFEMRDQGEALEDYWPNWSLRPGISRATLVLEVGNFSTKPILWPYWFETIFACHYFLKHPETVDGFVILDEEDYTLRLSNDSLPGHAEHTYREHGDGSPIDAAECANWCEQIPSYACVEQRCRGCSQCDASAKASTKASTKATAAAPATAAPATAAPATATASAAEGCAQWCGLPAKYKSSAASLASSASSASSAAALLSKQQPAERGQCGMLWFTHPPRTGGSSAWSVLERKAKRMGWRAHDSLDMDSPGPHRNDTWSWKHSKAWDALLDDLDVAAPTLILHHRQGMPGLSNLQLRTFLSRTKASLEAKGCSLLLATLMRAPLSRALSEAGTHNFVDEEEVRAYSLVRHDVQTRFLVSQQPKPKANCDPEHLATSRYRQAHHRLMPPWCYHREAAPLAQVDPTPSRTRTRAVTLTLALS